MAMVVSLCVVTHNAKLAGNWRKLFFSLELFYVMKFVASSLKDCLLGGLAPHLATWTMLVPLQS